MIATATVPATRDAPTHDFRSGSDASRLTNVATASMALLACWMAEIVFAARGGHSLLRWFPLIVTLALALALRGSRRGAFFDTRNRATERPDPQGTRWAFAACLVGFALPLVLQGCSHAWGWNSGTLEVSLLESLRNLTLLLAFGFVSAPLRRLSVVAGLFLAIYAFSSHATAVSRLLAGIYGAAGCCWLLSTHTDRLQLPAVRIDLELESPVPRRRRPVAVLLVVPLLLLCVAFSNPSRNLTRLVAGWLPSSGGQGWHDPRGWGGRGDGDQMILATQRADSFAAVESQLLLESKETSLYDLFSETYGEVRITRRNRATSIPLAPNEGRMNHAMKSRSESAGHEFSVLRAPPDAPRADLADRMSEALLHVDGRTPLHLKLEHFDAWDGVQLSAYPAEPPGSLRLAGMEGRTWVCWDAADTVSVAGVSAAPAHEAEDDERYTLRVIQLSSPTIPAPPQMRGIRVDKLLSTHLFSWNREGLLRYAGDRLPALSVLQVRAPRQVAERLRHRLFRVSAGAFAEPPTASSQESARDVDAESESDTVSTEARLSLDPSVLDLLHSWTRDAASDWEFIQKVTEGLRRHAVLDAKAAATAGSEDAVRDFLVHRRRGPDYLFALSAAVLLRHSRFDTRVVAGFYLPRESRLRAVGRSEVTRRHLHFWVEVRTVDGVWIPWDPSPGYLAAHEWPDWTDLARQALRAARRHLVDHRHAWLAITFATAAAFLQRYRLTQAFAGLAWWTTRRRDPRQRVLQTLRFVSDTARRQGRPRPPGESLEQWLAVLPLASEARQAHSAGQHDTHSPRAGGFRSSNRVKPIAAREEGATDRAIRRELVRLCQWAAYSGRDTPPMHAGRVEEICAALARPHASLRSVLRFDSCPSSHSTRTPRRDSPHVH